MLAGLRARFDAAALAAWALPLLLILYLALNNGGYDVIERSEAGIVVWWIVLVGTAVGALPVAGGTRAGRVMLALLAAFAGWTALSLSWTESAERTAIELARVVTYLGVLALALAVQGEGRWRHLLHGVTTGLAIVAGVAVLSRLEPTWFPERVTGTFLPGIEIERRLAYPLNYSSGLGALVALSLPLLLSATSSARTLAGQALAAAALPVAALALWLTGSGLSVPVAASGLLVFFALAPDRLPKLGSLLVAGAASAVLFGTLEARGALDRGLPTPAAQREGDEMLVIVLAVCAGVALAQAGLGAAVRHGRWPRRLAIPRSGAAVALAGGALALSIAALAAGAQGELSDRWEEFKSRGGDGPAGESRGAQILDFSGSGRYQFWQAAADANGTDPLLGIGPGTFEFWWAREGLYAGFIRDAHSLYMETLGELGIVGLVLIGGFVSLVLLIGAARALRAPPEPRLGIAAATAGCAAFAAAAAVDWVWELAPLPVAFMLLGAIAVAGGTAARRPVEAADPDSPPRHERLGAVRRHGERAALVALSLAALVVIVIPLASASALEESRRDAEAGDLGSALGEARSAASVQPYAATPRLQEALVLERLGELDVAALAARKAARRESTNWQTWLILSRLEARRGDAEAAVNAYRRARSLNPRSALFVR